MVKMKEKNQFKWSSFEKARSYVHGLKINSIKCWREYCRSGKKPDYIPADPYGVYKNQGWVDWYDWLGKKRNQWLAFKKARKYAQSLKLKSQQQWKEFVRSGGLPKNIPASPHEAYKDHGWISFPDWLGYKRFNWLSFTEARHFVHKLKLQSSTEWNAYINSGFLPETIPKTPNMIYKNQGWIDWCDWLGYKRNKWLPFAEAREYSQGLQLKSSSEWLLYCTSGNLPENIPATPYRVYKNEWVSWHDWLGSSYEKWLPFKVAREHVHKLNLSTRREWQKYCASGELPSKIPASPYRAYKNQGWVDWYDWLGKPRHHFLPFKKARRNIRKLNISCEEEWYSICRNDQIPDNIPVNPQIVYEKEGWKKWDDWLGIK